MVQTTVFTAMASRWQFMMFLSIILSLSTQLSTCQANVIPRFLNQNNNNNQNDYSYVDNYNMMFQGCHHVQQWNDNVDEDNDVRIMTKRLIRYRLCGSCSSCATDYGDYVMNMDDYLTAYLNSMQTVCQLAANQCGCGNDDSDCLSTCYTDNDLPACSQQNFLKGFTGCQQIKFNNNNNNNKNRYLQDNNNNQVKYYMGAYCAEQGGSIQLSIFTDDTCTTFASDGHSMFQSAYGYDLPFSQSSLVSHSCKACDPYADSENNNNNNNQQYSFCIATYKSAGKCETKMKVDYPNESSCNYIEGIKIIRDDGVIRTSSVHQSKAAAVGIGIFTTAAVLLGAYVYFLRTKLMRAQINLHASTQALT